VLFGGRKDLSHPRGSHTIAIVRDIVEVAAIVAAGVWAFYVFAYENRIKPAMASPEVNVTASLQRLSDRNGLIAVGVHIQLHNIGTVRAHFLGIAVNVFGQRILTGASQRSFKRQGLEYNFSGFSRAGSRVPVFSYAYITHLGNPATGQDTALDPGSAIENERTFYVPHDRFDLLTLGIDMPFTKYDDTTIPAHLDVTPQGAATVVVNSEKVDRYNILPVTSLDVR
jgi:hypothetical protein